MEFAAEIISFLGALIALITACVVNKKGKTANQSADCSSRSENIPVSQNNSHTTGNQNVVVQVNVNNNSPKEQKMSEDSKSGKVFIYLQHYFSVFVFIVSLFLYLKNLLLFEILNGLIYGILLFLLVITPITPIYKKIFYGIAFTSFTMLSLLAYRGLFGATELKSTISFYQQSNIWSDLFLKFFEKPYETIVLICGILLNLFIFVFMIWCCIPLIEYQYDVKKGKEFITAAPGALWKDIGIATLIIALLLFLVIVLLFLQVK